MVADSNCDEDAAGFDNDGRKSASVGPVSMAKGESRGTIAKKNAEDERKERIKLKIKKKIKFFLE